MIIDYPKYGMFTYNSIAFFDHRILPTGFYTVSYTPI